MFVFGFKMCDYVVDAGGHWLCLLFICSTQSQTFSLLFSMFRCWRQVTVTGSLAQFVVVPKFFTPHPWYIGDGVMFAIDFFVSLFVSLSARLRENGWTNLHEIFREGVEWPWDDLITFLVNSEKPRDAAMRNTGAGFVVLYHHSLFRIIFQLTYYVERFLFSHWLCWWFLQQCYSYCAACDTD